MYTSRTGLVLGFHGTDETVVQEVLSGKSDLKSKNNTYDWLGHGIYFWDNSPSRALEWATQLSKRKDSSIKNPAVIGAIIDLGYCLDLLDYKNLDLIRKSYEMLEITFNASESYIPKNKGNTVDLLQRELDCAVIEWTHEWFEGTGKKRFDSVRGVFWEGDPLYRPRDFVRKTISKSVSETSIA